MLAGTGLSRSVFLQSKQGYDAPPRQGPSWLPRHFSHMILMGTLEVAGHLFFSPPQRGEDRNSRVSSSLSQGQWVKKGQS